MGKSGAASYSPPLYANVDVIITNCSRKGVCFFFVSCRGTFSTEKGERWQRQIAAGDNRRYTGRGVVNDPIQSHGQSGCYRAPSNRPYLASQRAGAPLGSFREKGVAARRGREGGREGHGTATHNSACGHCNLLYACIQRWIDTARQPSRSGRSMDLCKCRQLESRAASAVE